MSKEDVKGALIKIADKVSSGAEVLMEKTRDWQLIKLYLTNRLNDMKLSAEQQRKLERYQYMYNQMVSGKYTDQEVLTSTMRMYNICLPQAYDDMNSTREIFSSVVNINKRFELQLQLQLNRNMIRKAEELGDMKAAAAFEKNRVLLLRELPDKEVNPADLFEGHTIDAVFDPKLLGAPDVDMNEVLKAINEKRSKKIKIDMFIEDLPFVDVTDEETTPL